MKVSEADQEKSPDENVAQGSNKQFRRRRDKLKKGQNVQEAVAAQSKTKKAGRLIIRNLSFDASQKHLCKMFSKVGALRETHVPLKEEGETKKTRHPGFGFVEFMKLEDAEKAINELNGKKLCGRPMSVAYALQKGVYDKNKSKPSSDVPRLKQKLGDDLPPVDADFEEEKQRMKRVLDSDVGKRKYEGEGKMESEGAKPRKENVPEEGPDETTKKRKVKEASVNAVGMEENAKKKRKKNKEAVAKSETEENAKEKRKKNKEAVAKSETEENAKEKRKKNKEAVAKSEAEEIALKKRKKSKDASAESENAEESEDETDIAKKSDDRTRCGHDLAEGKTVFIRNVPYDAHWKDVKSACEKYGEIDRVFLCKKDGGGHKGTGFVKFKDALGAQNALKEEASVKEKMRQLGFKDHLTPIDGCGVMVKDRRVIVMEATTPGEAPQRKDARKAERRALKESWAHLLSMGSINEKKHPEKWAQLSKGEKRLRTASQKERTFQKNDPNYIVNPLRLSIRNLDLKIDGTALTKAISAAGLSEGERKLRPKKVTLMRSKDRNTADGIRRSLGYAFAEFGTHEDAIATLRYLNNNADALGVAKRPIVEFAMEDKRKLRILEVRRTLQKKKDDVKEW